MITFNPFVKTPAAFTPKHFGQSTSQAPLASDDNTLGATTRHTPTPLVGVPSDVFATPPATLRPVTPVALPSDATSRVTTNPFNFGYNPQTPPGETGILRPVITSELPAHMQSFGAKSLCGSQLCVMG
jgi:hypothetical protein